MLTHGQENSSAAPGSSENSKPKTLLKCSYKGCTAKPWFKGFLTRIDYDLHMQNHRCQWINPKNETLCLYTPRDEEDGMNHMKHHINHDDLASEWYI